MHTIFHARKRKNQEKNFRNINAQNGHRVCRFNLDWFGYPCLWAVHTNQVTKREFLWRRLDHILERLRGLTKICSASFLDLSARIVCLQSIRNQRGLFSSKKVWELTKISCFLHCFAWKKKSKKTSNYFLIKRTPQPSVQCQYPMTTNDCTNSWSHNRWPSALESVYRICFSNILDTRPFKFQTFLRTCVSPENRNRVESNLIELCITNTHWD